jgi:branched-chain amino acid transport system permease protein
LTDTANLLISGLGLGAVYALIAIGYNIIFASTNVLNFAQGDLVMCGTFAGLECLAVLHWHPLVALVAAVAVGIVIGVIEEALAVRPAIRRNRNATGWVLATLGVSIVLEALSSFAFGDRLQYVPDFLPIGVIKIYGLFIIPQLVLIIGCAILLTVVLVWFYRNTRLGQALGAIAQDREAAAMRGIPVARLAALAFGLGAGVAGLAGFMTGPLTGAYPLVGLLFAFKGFIAAALGGIPSIQGGLAGGLFLGIVEVLAGRFVGNYLQIPVIVLALLALLSVRPHGLIKTSSVRDV